MHRIPCLSNACYNNNGYLEVEAECTADIKVAASELTRDTWVFIRTRHPRLPTFYTLPKVHKDFMILPEDLSSPEMALSLKE